MKLALKVITWTGFILLVLSVIGWGGGFVAAIVDGIAEGRDGSDVTLWFFIVSPVVFGVGMILLLVKVAIERLRNKEDTHYSKNVHH